MSPRAPDRLRGAERSILPHIYCELLATWSRSPSPLRGRWGEGGAREETREGRGSTRAWESLAASPPETAVASEASDAAGEEAGEEAGSRTERLKQLLQEVAAMKQAVASGRGA